MDLIVAAGAAGSTTPASPAAWVGERSPRPGPLGAPDAPARRPRRRRAARLAAGLSALALLAAWPGADALAVECPGLPPGVTDLGPLEDPSFEHAHAIGPVCDGAVAEAGGGAVTLSSGGNRIWQGPDQLLFAYGRRAGDFSVRVTIASRAWVPGSRWGKVGILAREDCSESSRYTFVHDCGEDPGDGARLSYRPTHGGSDDVELVPPGPPAHPSVLRLDRTGSVLAGYLLDEDGALGGVPGAWLELGRHEWGADAPPDLLLGLAITSNSGCEPATAVLRDWEIRKPATPFLRGDADGDGRVSVLDAVFTATRLALGVDRLPCEEAADVDDDGAVGPLDVASLLQATLLGGLVFLPPPGTESCGLDPRDGLAGTLGCARYAACGEPLPRPEDPASALSLGEPSRASGRPGGIGSVESAVLLDAPGGISGWTVSLRSSCPIDIARVAGTAAAPVGADPAGRVADGFQETRIEGGGLVLVAAVALSATDPARTLEPAGSHPILRVAVRPDVPFGGCGECALSFEDGLGLGRYLSAAVTGSGAIRPVAADASLASCCELRTLELGAELRLPADAASRTACVRVPAPTPDAVGKAVAVSLASEGPSPSGLIYARWGPEASPVAYDAAALDRSAAVQSLVLPYARPEELSLLVDFPDGPAGVERTLRVEIVDAALTSISPARSSRTAVRTIVRGGRFEDGLELALAGEAGDEAPANSVSPVWLDEAEAVFDLSGATPGEYDLVARRQGIELDRLDGAFRVTDEPGRPRFELELDAPESYRNGELAIVALRWGNSGDAPSESPLVQLEGPAGTVFSLDGRDDFHEGKLQLLAVGGDGRGELAPGVFVEAPVFFRSLHDIDAGTTLEFRASALRPVGAAPLDWRALPRPGGLTPAEWETVLAGLEDRLGDTWGAYETGLARLATSLARLGLATTSVARIFDLAALEAFGAPTGAIAGQVVDRDGALVRGALVVARTGSAPGGAIAAVSQTLDDGKFALEWLAPGSPYRLEVDGYELAAPVVVDAAGTDDERDLLLVVADASTAPAGVACPGCAPTPLPGEPPTIPAEHLVEMDSDSSDVLASRDPNSKEGDEVEGAGDPFGAARPGEEVAYRIHFENVAAATAPAKSVVIEDILDARLDGGTLRFLEAGFGDLAFVLSSGDVAACAGSVPPPAPSGPPTAPSTAGYLVQRRVCATVGDADYCVRVRAELQQVDVSGAARWRAKWVFETFPPDCDPLGDVGPSGGFLPPDDGDPDTRDSEGHVGFAVRLREDLTDEEPIRNSADIKFDANAEVFSTPEVVTQVSLDPEPPLHPVPASGAGRVPVATSLSWRRAELAATYRVFVWREGSPRPPSPAAIVSDPEHVLAAPLDAEARYRWQVVSESALGATAAGAEWTFETEGGWFVRGDSNADGRVDISDAIFSLAALFLGGPQSGCDDAADANDDGGVDISDPIFLLGWLFQGSGVEPPPPTPTIGGEGGLYPATDCGPDPTADAIGCGTPFAPCP